MMHKDNIFSNKISNKVWSFMLLKLSIYSSNLAVPCDLQLFQDNNLEGRLNNHDDNLNDGSEIFKKKI